MSGLNEDIAGDIGAVSAGDGDRKTKGLGLEDPGAPNAAFYG